LLVIVIYLKQAAQSAANDTLYALLVPCTACAITTVIYAVILRNRPN